jgi:hypothetical protein
MNAWEAVKTYIFRDEGRGERATHSATARGPTLDFALWTLVWWRGAELESSTWALGQREFWAGRTTVWFRKDYTQ